MTLGLEDYEKAFDRVERKLDLGRDRGQAERKIRRRLQGPTIRLVGTLVLIIVTCVSAFAGAHVWGVAAFLTLVVIPKQWGSARQRAHEIETVGSAQDLRALCEREAERCISRTFLRGVLQIAFALLFLLTGLIAYMVGQSPMPGVLAAAVVLALGLTNFLVWLPRATREREFLRG